MIRFLLFLLCSLSAFSATFSLDVIPRDKDTAESIKKAISQRKAVVGMTKQEVKNIWGTPKSITKGQDKLGKFERWHYRRTFTVGTITKTQIRFVYFRDETVSLVQETVSK